MDKLLHKTRNTFAFIEDILIVTKRTKRQHIEKVEEVLTILEEAGIRLKLEKRKTAQTKTEWLGFKLSESGVKQLMRKIRLYRTNYD